MENNRIVIQSNPTSYHTAELSEIVLSETQRTKLVFEPVHVDNPDNPERQLKGRLVYSKPKANQDEATRLTRRSILAGEYISLELHTDEVYNLAKGLCQYLDVTRFRGSPLQQVSYVEDVPDDSVSEQCEYPEDHQDDAVRISSGDPMGLDCQESF